MNQLPHEQLCALLQKISRVAQVETFKNFPEIVRVGEQQLPKDDFDYLLAEGYLCEKKTDSFGKLLILTERAKNILSKVE